MLVVTYLRQTDSQELPSFASYYSSSGLQARTDGSRKPRMSWISQPGQCQKLKWMSHRCRRRRLVSVLAVCGAISCLFLLYCLSNPDSFFRSADEDGADMYRFFNQNDIGGSLGQTFHYPHDLTGKNRLESDYEGRYTTHNKFDSHKNYYNEEESSDSYADRVDDDINEKTKSLQEIMDGVNRAVGTASSRTQSRKHFVKEKTDLFSTDGDESDYLFPPCQEDGTFQSNSMYGFVGPFRYLANYKNPCWMEPGEGDVPVVYCVPYFYLAGAPKAGSTDLYRRIIMHPEVVKPASKETRWFDRARFSDKPHFSSFLNNFFNASRIISRSLDKGTNYHRRIVGDGSPSYFFDNNNWPRMPGNEGCEEPRVTVASHIHHLFPEARIIFILRNPVDRLYSSYLYNHAKHHAVSSRTFDMYVRDAISLYTDCFARYSLRVCANNATLFRQDKVMLIISLYVVFVRDWMELFPREQLLVVSTEHYHHNMDDHLNKIFTFLGLRTLNSTELQVITNHTIYNKGQHYSGAGPMMTETRQLLEDFFRPYNQKLASLLNDPQFLWME